MACIMALDVGETTIGVAVSDDLETFAFPEKTIARQEGHRRDMAALRELVAARGVSEIVVGLPLMMDGSRGIQAQKIDEFVAILARYIPAPIHLQDERLSTAEAERVLIAADQKRGRRKLYIDSMAASVILQRFLESRKRESAGN